MPRNVPALLTSLALWFCTTTALMAADPPRSPFDLAWSPDGRTLAVTDHTAAQVHLLDRSGKMVARVALRGRPAGLVWSADGKSLFVGESGAGTIAQVQVAGGKVARRLDGPMYPAGLALAGHGGRLLVADYGGNSVSMVDLAGGKTVQRFPVLRQPFAIAVSADEKLALVTNMLPEGRASNPTQAAAVSLLDLSAGRTVAHLRLPPGSTCVREVTISPDGKQAFVVHTVGRTNLPTTQLERGWVNTNGLTVIDLPGRKILATVLLDHPMQGAADPWAVLLSDDGKTLWVSLSGIHQLARIDLQGLNALLDDPKTNREELVNDLAALYRNDLIQRIDLPGKGPRGLDGSPDGKQLAVAMYFSQQVLLIDTDSAAVTAAVALGDDKPGRVDLARRGEQIFHDATYCFQNWLTCASCHPDGRVDGMNWDLLNDGLGNPKNVKSLVWSARTPPAMSTGVRDTMETAVAAGFRHIQFRQVGDDVLEAVRQYIRTLEPLPSPYRQPDGQLSAAAQRGKKIFHDDKVACAKCHPDPLFTDKQRHNVGTRGPLDRTDYFDTPTLVELWRSAPFLHDGSAKDLHEVLTDKNHKDRHGHTSHLSPQQIQDLIEYLNSL